MQSGAKGFPFQCDYKIITKQCKKKYIERERERERGREREGEREKD